MRADVATDSVSETKADAGWDEDLTSRLHNASNSVKTNFALRKTLPQLLKCFTAYQAVILI